MKYRWKRRINRIISLILSISMFMPFCAQFAQVYATEPATSVYAENIGYTVTFNKERFPEFYIAEEPYATGFSDIASENIITSSDIPDDFVGKIVDYAIFDVDESSKVIWYKLQEANGYSWPEVFGERVWVIQNWTNFPEEDNSLILHTKEEINEGTPIYDADGEVIDTVSLPQYETREIYSESDLEGDVAYQWQIQYGEGEDEWADIYGMNSPTIKLSYGLVATRLMDAGFVNIRCMSVSGNDISYSRTIPVSVEWYEAPSEDETEKVVVEQVFITSSGEPVTVTVYGNLPDDAELSLEEADADDIEINENETITAAFDIKILDADGEEWQPESGESVEVTLPAEACGLELDDTYVIYHLHGDEVEILGPYTVTGDTITFVVDGFSVFVFALVDDSNVPESPYDYEESIGMHAVINEDLDPSEVYLFVSENSPTEGWMTSSIVFDLEAFEDVKFEIEDYKVLEESYRGYDEYNELVDKSYVTLWYQVRVLEGGVLDSEFEDGFWILQNYLNEEDKWEFDSLTLFETEVVEKPEELSVAIKVDGEEVSEIEVGGSKKVTVEAELSVASASNAYQWQIYIPAADMWVDIYGETDAKCTVSYGMVSQRLDSDGCAYICCVVTTDDGAITSEEIVVTIVEEAKAADNVVENALKESPQLNNHLQTSNPNVSDDELPKEQDILVDSANPEAQIPAEDDALLDGGTLDSDVLKDNALEANGSQVDIPVNNKDTADEEQIIEDTKETEVLPIVEDSTTEEVVPEDTSDDVMIVNEDVEADDTKTTEEPEPTQVLALNDRVKLVARNVITTTTASGSSTENIIQEDAAVEDIDYGVALVDDETANETTKIYNVKINYVFTNGAPAATPYTTTVGETAILNSKVSFPEVLGYLPYLDEVQTNSYTFDLNGKEMTEDFVMTVVYKPTLVNYTVIVKLQNLYDDEYSEQEPVVLQGLTGSLTENIDISYPGFYQLLHAKYEIAADGSTVVEVKFDRYYYLMTFNLGEGGYGVYPVYARYGTEVEVPNPTRTGYVFQHWTNPNGTIVTSPITMPAYDIEITANWTPSNTKYTVVYWRENADPEADGTYGYSYWGSVIVESTSGMVVSGSDDISTSININEKEYFTYNAAKTDKNVVVKGDGSTVVNVYYTRNSYTILFKGYGTCCLPEHEHGTDCNTPLICGLEEHIHSAECNGILSCGLAEHEEHDEDCLVCELPEHTEHTAECLQCTHSVHTLSCYCYGNRNNVLTQNNKTSAPTNSDITSQAPYEDGKIYKYSTEDWWGNTTYYYLYLDGQWYWVNYGRTEIRLSCTHTHTTECYKDNLHTHDASCYIDVVHTHGESCYKYSCGSVGHTHNSNCYGACTKIAHNHNTDCNSNDTDNVVYVLTAKYDADISALWPTYEILQTSPKSTHYKNASNEVVNGTGNNASLFRGWSIDGVTNEAVSKRFNMTSDLCDTEDGEKNAVANYGYTYQVHLYYMFESFDQTSPADGNNRIYYNNKYYDLNTNYYQDVYAGSSGFSQKQILGMDPVGTQSERVTNSEYNNFLYYDRNRHTLYFQNIDTIVRTENNIMYGVSLSDYKNQNGEEFIPNYPSSLETGAYEFGGWYTTVGCYAGTEVNFETMTMPNLDLTLYAKWQPITHEISFYTSKDVNGNLIDKIGHTYEVSHGSKINEQYIPDNVENGNYTFNGWYYMDSNDVEKRYDFENMMITQDLDVYAKWTSNTLIQYIVHYELEDGTPIADSLEGSDLAGATKTFEAKGGKNLYALYQSGYFPNTKTHSILLDINDADGVMEYTFVYTKVDAVPYMVYYLAETLKAGDSGLGYHEVNGKKYYMLHTTKTVTNNVNAVATENFVTVSGYMPDAYQKSLVVVPGSSDNVIYFYYTVDNEHAFYKVSHYTQNLDGTTWTEHYTYQAQGSINSEYTETSMSIPGFTYNPAESIPSGKLEADGLHLKLYYTRNKYPYKVVYKDQGTGDILYTSEVETEYYGNVVSDTAPSLYRDNVYKRESEATKTLDIRIEESATAPKLNIIVFYYTKRKVTVNYEVIGPTGCGTVSPKTETIDIDAASAVGSIATASNKNFIFKGWYLDAECITSVPSGWISGGKITPLKVGNLWSDSTTDPITFTYYAKFDYNLTTLTIKKDGYDAYSILDANQTFLFHVSGNGVNLTVTVHGEDPVTITGLTVGESYTVTEVSDWSWRYGVNNWKFTIDGNTDSNGKSKDATITLGPSGNEIVFTNQRNNPYWLDGDSYKVNVFTNS